MPAEKDPAATRTTIAIGDTKISFDQEKLNTLNPEARKAFLTGIAQLVIKGEMSGETLQLFEATGLTLSVPNEDGSVDQVTAIGDGVAIEEHLPAPPAQE